MSAAVGQDRLVCHRSQSVPDARISGVVDTGAQRDRDRQRIALKRITPQHLLVRVGLGAVAATLLVGTGGLVGTTSVSAGTSPLTPHVGSVVGFSATAASTLDTHVAENVAPSLSNSLIVALVQTSDVAATVPDQAADALRNVAELADSTGAAVATFAGYTAPISGATITSGYGMRWGRMHNGLDFSAPIGHPLQAIGGGTVTNGYSANGMGINIRIMLDDGTEVTYGHMSELLVADGQRVEAGDVIGRVGNTGRSTGPHLHLEVRLQGGDRVDPHGWLTQRGLL